MQDIDRLSRRVPVLCKVAPSVADVHVEDVHRAGGIMAHPGRAGPGRAARHRGLPTVHAPSLAEAMERWDVAAHRDDAVRDVLPRRAGRRADDRSPSARRRAGTSSTSTASAGVIRDKAHAFSADGGLAVLYGNLAEEGCIVKTAGVDASILRSPARRGCSRARMRRSRASSAARCRRATSCVVRYEGPRGGPGMQEMLYPTSYLKSKGLGKPARW